MAAPAAAIAGIHEFEKRAAGGLSPLQIKAECAARALEDAGLTWADVDAVYDASEAGRMQGLTIAEYFGVTPRVLDTTAVGGSSYEFHAAHAARDIAAGKANVALLTYGSTAHSDRRAIGTGWRGGSEAQPAANMERPYGLTLVGNYAMVARRHMAQYGTTPEQLAEIAVTTRRHAMRNPQAVAGLADIGIKDVREITVDDVLGSRLIADPLHLLDCCLVSNGGAAVIVTSAQHARDLAQPPVDVLGWGQAHPGTLMHHDSAFGLRTGAAVAGPAALKMAGVTVHDVDLLELYDSYTYTVLITLEDYGFCQKGQGGDFVSDGTLGRGGTLPCNTGGGQLSSYYLTGFTPVIEAVIQGRRQAGARQVAKNDVIMVSGSGGVLEHHATLVLGGGR